MRLSQIKLAGFKSFVDATTVPFPANLSGVVGPNGCGKSNIIDAVRWVMGESSAKNLRADTMDEVIFNGSTSRNAAGHAAVELHFDNSDGRLGGEYAHYAEIVIRRQVSLDGQSSYYLNGTGCRRRDIRDIFLGTGLGPRSYAIIEQGMISRLIEAKPEELRIYLEEAAGISKYKERRRETELRLQHTRDNLARLSDLRDELQKQLDHLSKQAQLAEKYHDLKSHEKTLKIQLWTIRANDIALHKHKNLDDIALLENQLEKINTDYQANITRREIEKQHYTECSDAVQAAQRIFYQHNTDLATAEQGLAHHRERCQSLSQTLTSITKETEITQNNLNTEKNKYELLLTNYNTLVPQVDDLKILADNALGIFQGLEIKQQDWQHRWDEFNQSASQHSREAQVAQTQLQHSEKQLLTLQERLAKLEAEKTSIIQLTFPAEIQILQEAIRTIAENINQYQQTINHIHQELQQIRENHQGNQTDLDKARTQLQSLKGRFASLQALQEAALGKNSESKTKWLQKYQLHTQPRLAEKLTVEPGYELAVETLLSDYLEAVCIDNINEIITPLDDLSQSSLTFIENNYTNINVNINLNQNLLIHKIKAPSVINHLLRGIYIADDLITAIALLDTLSPAESVMTKQGIWVGKGWLRVKAQDDKAGVISRERELSQLQQEIAVQIEWVEKYHNQLIFTQEKLSILETDRDTAQKELSILSARHADLNAQLKVQEAKIIQTEHRKGQLINDIQELVHQQSHENERLKTIRQEWQGLMDKIESDVLQKEQLQTEREVERDSLLNARADSQEAQQKLHQLMTQCQVLQTQCASCQENQTRLENQLLILTDKAELINNQLTDALLPENTLKDNLNQLLLQQQQAQQEVKVQQDNLSGIDSALKILEKTLITIELDKTTHRTQLEQKRIEQEGLNTRLDNIMNQLQELKSESESDKTELPEDLSESDCETQLSKIINRIERLGPINLAAISELTQQSERKHYLDQQNDDLISALETLDGAIHKIDKETRDRFKEVYEKVNQLFQELFPRIFGGGHAYLELTGEDLLQTGVNVIARPPGKKNSSIHLLSGGEKALTAIALVFSIFRLNPAPFCMLDEVDAPLDDANIGRFCELVKEMSKDVQFIFISHNKLAIEMADHLIGVTMNEPGVSRLVAVDVSEVMDMAMA